MTSTRLNLLGRTRSTDETPVRGIALRPRELASELRAGRGDMDVAFDRFLPIELRVVSRQYWTPLEVALRAASWFSELGVSSVVDIGSGAGKFCVAAALASRCCFTGLEHRARLVDAARDLARTLEVQDRVSFVCGALGEQALAAADAYYMYNPFGENLFESEDHIDADVELGDERYVRDIGAAEALLQAAPRGTYLLTYNGFGGQIPQSYTEVRADTTLRNALRLWHKTWDEADVQRDGVIA